MNSVSDNVLRALSVSIDRSALLHNYRVAKRYANGASVFAVIKADAYGHGAVEVAKTLDVADAFAVVTTGEAISLREAQIPQPILVLQGPSNLAELQDYVNYKLWPAIHDESQLAYLESFSEQSLIDAWLKIDTGMGRLGFTMERAVAILNQSKHAKWFGMLTHLANADCKGCASVTEQAERFSSLQRQFPALKTSIGNSAGSMAWPDFNADWLRPGLMLYGSSPFEGSTGAIDGLQAVMRASAPLISVKTLQKGTAVGYAGTYCCPETMCVGYVGAGYGDGLPRVLDSSACVSINGINCPIIGRVSMDSMAIDLRLLNKVNVGDEAVFWGPELPIELLAQAASTISYELMTHVRGKRTYT